LKRSGDRILCTHTGSLPRPDELLAMLQAREAGQLGDRTPFRARVRAAVAEVVRQQADPGLDDINDGELGKVDFSTYIKERLSGFEGETTAEPRSREATLFPGYWAQRGNGIGVKIG